MRSSACLPSAAANATKPSCSSSCSTSELRSASSSSTIRTCLLLAINDLSSLDVPRWTARTAPLLPHKRAVVKRGRPAPQLPAAGPHGGVGHLDHRHDDAEVIQS